MEDIREGNTLMDELFEDLSHLDETLHNARNEVLKITEKKDKFADLLKKMKEIQKEKNRFQAMFEKETIKYKVEKSRMLDQMEKLKMERDKFENIVNLIKKRRKKLKFAPTDDIVENNTTSVSKSTSSVSETVIESPTHNEAVLEFSLHSQDVISPTNSESFTHSKAVSKSDTYKEAILESITDTETTFDVSCQSRESQALLESPIHSRAVLRNPHIGRMVLVRSSSEKLEIVEEEDEPRLANKKQKLEFSENKREKVKSAEQVINKIGYDGVMAGSSNIGETENSALMESVTEVQLEESCVTLNSPTSTVDIVSDLEDSFLVGGGEGSTDSRLSYAENKREIAEAKKKVKIVVPEKENYSIETIVDCSNNYQVKDMKRKRSDITMEVKVRNDLFPATIKIPEDLISRKKNKSKFSKSFSKSKSQSSDQNLNMKDTVQDNDQVVESTAEAN